MRRAGAFLFALSLQMEKCPNYCLGTRGGNMLVMKAKNKKNIEKASRGDKSQISFL